MTALSGIPANSQSNQQPANQQPESNAFALQGSERGGSLRRSKAINEPKPVLFSAKGAPHTFPEKSRQIDLRKNSGNITKLAEEDRLRADLYGLLAVLLTAPPPHKRLLELQALGGDATELGQAFEELAKSACKTSEATARAEYNTLFIGLTRGDLVPYASYYLTGFLYEKPLARLCGAMSELGISRNEACREPEDHIGSLMEMMSGLITGFYGKCASLETQRDFFEAHIATWARNFFKDLEESAHARLYRPVGTLGRLFMDIERDAFAMS